MPPKLAVRFRAICVAVAVAAATASTVQAASAKQDPLIGQTREQVLAQFGEPKNTIVAGNREVLFFDRDRITLRDNVVIQTERIAEPVRRAPEPVAPAPAATTTPPGTAPADSAAAPRRAGKEAEGGETPLPVVPNAAAKSNASAAPTTSGTTTTAPAAPAVDPNAPLEIKVRAPGATRPAPKVETPPPSTTPAAPATSAAKSAAPATTSPATTAPIATPPPAKPAADLAKAGSTTTPAPAEGEAAKPADASAAPADAAKADEPAATADDAAAKGKKKGRVRRTVDGEIVEEPVFTAQTYFIGAVTIGAGIAFLYWRSRQRQLELAATAVSRTPFSAPVATGGGGAIFTADLLGKLEWKRFEELVAAYYSKTGVVAARTKSGPKAPVHIKISWKGEPRPFALVQCLAQRKDLIDATPLQELVTALAAEDIRRGYVVTTGKFNVAARDLAEEKHITLLSGDILLEKINALPEAARAELMTEVTTGDYTTPSCPVCEAKMVKNPDDSSQWRCATHTDQVIPVR